MSLKKSILLFTYPAGILLVIFLLSVVTGSRVIWTFFNSDTLYFSSIYTDLFIHHTGVGGWHLNGSPNFFPEMLVYMGLMWILKETALASFVYSILQFVAIMYLMQKFLRTLDTRVRIETLILVNSLFLLLILSSIFGENVTFPFQLLISGYHAGFFINLLLAGITGFIYIRRGRPGALALTGIIVILATVSDRLFMVGFVVPMLITALLALTGKDTRIRFILFASVVLVGAYIGLRIFRWLDEGPVINFFGTGAKMYLFENALTSFGNLFRHMAEIITDYPLQRWFVLFSMMFVLAAAGYLIYRLVVFLKDRMERSERDQYILVLFLFISSVAIFVAPAVNGYYLGVAHLRYNFPALILGSAGFLYLLVKFLQRYSWFTPATRYLVMAVAFALLTIIVSTGIRENIVPGVRAYVNHYPDKSRILDNLKEEFDLKYGIANYWHANHATTFSKNNVRVYAVHDVDLKPYYHMVNKNWYHDGGKGEHSNPIFNFVYADAGYDKEGKLRRIFGEEMDTIYLKNNVIVIKLPDFKFDRKTREIVILEQGKTNSGGTLRNEIMGPFLSFGEDPGNIFPYDPKD